MVEQMYTIKNQLGHQKTGIRIGGFHAREGSIIGVGLWISKLVLYGIRIVGFHAWKGSITGALVS